MKIITVAHQKGGVGKTTLAMNLAVCLQMSKLKVGVLDTDLQGSLAGIASSLEGIKFVQPDALSDLVKLQNNFDILVIDTPPYLINSLHDLFGISDYVLIPTKIGFYDVMAIRATLSIIKEVQKTKPSLQYGVVINMLKANTNLTDDILQILKSYEATLLKTRIHDRVSYTRSSIVNGVFETDDLKAHDEIIRMTEEVLSVI